MAEEASISALMDRVARTAPFHRELAKLGTEEQAVFDHTSLPGVPFVAALCIRTLPDTARSEERRVGKECRSRWSPYH